MNNKKEKKTAYIVNYYHSTAGLTGDDTIEVYLSEEDKKEKNFSFRYNYKTINNGTPSNILDKFFMAIRDLQINGYELKFICEKGNKEV